jgi:hypothetical protein
MRVYVVRKWPLRGRNRFVFWNIPQVSLWLLCNVHFVRSTQRSRLQTRPFVRGINNLLKLECLCKQKSSGRPLTAEDDVEWVRPIFLHSPKKSTGPAAKELSMSKTTVWRVLRKRFLVINVCNHGEHYETPCMWYLLKMFIVNKFFWNVINLISLGSLRVYLVFIHKEFIAV